MERKNLADYLTEGGAGGEQFMTPQGEVYTCLGITPASAGEKQDLRKSMKILKDGGLEEQVDIDSHLEDLKVAVELTTGKFYEFVSGRQDGKEGKVVYYDGKNLIDEFRNKLDPSKTKGLRQIEDANKYIESLDKTASSFYEGKRKAEGLSDFMRAYLDRKSDAADVVGAAGAVYTSKGSDEKQEIILEPEDSFGGDPGLLDLSLDKEDENFDDILETLGSEESQLDDPNLDEEKEPALRDSLEDTAYPTLEEPPKQEPALRDSLEDTDFGSGSGLLDLSLQADDTSLGGILDEIYTAEDPTPGNLTLEDTAIYEPPKQDTNPSSNSLSLEDTAAEIPLEQIEDDIDLDAFGSGSGLLDLSLQADDTSLGGILDEIYLPETKSKPTKPKYIPTTPKPRIKSKPKNKGPITKAWKWFWNI